MFSIGSDGHLKNNQRIGRISTCSTAGKVNRRMSLADGVIVIPCANSDDGSDSESTAVCKSELVGSSVMRRRDHSYENSGITKRKEKQNRSLEKSNEQTTLRLTFPNDSVICSTRKLTKTTVQLGSDKYQRSHVECNEIGRKKSPESKITTSSDHAVVKKSHTNGLPSGSAVYLSKAVISQPHRTTSAPLFRNNHKPRIFKKKLNTGEVGKPAAEGGNVANKKVARSSGIRWLDRPIVTMVNISNASERWKNGEAPPLIQA